MSDLQLCFIILIVFISGTVLGYCLTRIKKYKWKEISKNPEVELWQISELFQQQVAEWTKACFGDEISKDRTERNHRFLEESLELVQSLGCTKSEARQLVEYVFNRPAGEPTQELGGVMVTLAALSNANNFPMNLCGYRELTRVWKKIQTIRDKQAAKPKHSPLP
jgi:uncharacterized protein YneF (UPF0154 family)